MRCRVFEDFLGLRLLSGVEHREGRMGGKNGDRARKTERERERKRARKKIERQAAKGKLNLTP